MIPGSVTSIGFAYPRVLCLEELAQHTYTVLEELLAPTNAGRFPLRCLKTGTHSVRAETTLRTDQDRETNIRLLSRYLSADYAEIEAAVSLPKLGRIDAVIRPEAALNGLLLDLPDASLFPERVAGAVDEAIVGFIEQWFSISRFRVAFADHEAEFDTEPLDLGERNNPYAVLAVADSQAEEPLRIYRNRWHLDGFGGSR